MDIGSGITIGPGIRIAAPVGSSIRSALSTEGQTAYDAAAAGNFIRVSAVDYNSVRTTLSNTKTIGDNAAAILASGGAYSGICAALNNPANSNVDPGFYIIGFVARHLSTSNAVFRYLTSTSDRGTYTQLANSALVTNLSNSPSYYIRKDPTDVSVSTIYVGIVSNTGQMLVSNTNWSNAAFDCSEPYSSWTSRTGTQPVFQTLLTGDKQW